MKSLSLINFITRHWKDQDTGADSFEDRSYEDALLDWKLRRFMQAEYGKAEPPKGIFSRVLAAIKAGRSSEASTAARIGAWVSSLAIRFYNSLAKPNAATRIIPGMVAFGLVVLVLSTNSNNILHINHFEDSNLYSQPAMTSSGQLITTELAALAKQEQVTRRGNLPEGLSQFYPPPTIGFYHPVERHLSAPKKHQDDTGPETIIDYSLISRGGGF